MKQKLDICLVTDAFAISKLPDGVDIVAWRRIVTGRRRLFWLARARTSPSDVVVFWRIAARRSTSTSVRCFSHQTAVPYGAIFGTGYGLVLGPMFGLVNGIAHGITLGWEYSRASRIEPKPGFWVDTRMSAIRGCGFGLGAGYLFGARFGVTFGILGIVGPDDHLPAWHPADRRLQTGRRPRVTLSLLLAAANRPVGYMATGYFSSLVAQQREHAIAVGLKADAIDVVTGIVGPCTPFIEWQADHVPERRMGFLVLA